MRTPNLWETAKKGVVGLCMVRIGFRFGASGFGCEFSAENSRSCRSQMVPAKGGADWHQGPN